MRWKLSLGDRMFNAFSIGLVWIVVFATLYPFLYVFSSSISSPSAVMQNKVFFLPVGFSLEAYKMIFAYDSVTIGYLNTIIYTVGGTVINMLLTSTMAYPLSRKSLVFRKFFMIVVTITLIVNGGMIPTYLVVQGLGLLDTRWALLLPAAISTWNLILLKTFFENIPKEMEEAAMIDGASYTQILVRVILPLSLPAIATISLFYAVTHWNSFFPALIYLRSEELYPIQLFLRSIVLLGQTTDIMADSSLSAEEMLMTESLKYATIVIVALPIIMVYPFIQKYFVKGIMIGSLKG